MAIALPRHFQQFQQRLFRDHKRPRQLPGWAPHLVAFALGAAVAIAILTTATMARAEPVYPNLFGYTEVRKNNISNFKKWTGTLERYFQDSKIKEGSCTSTFFTRCHMQDWKAFLDGLQGEDRMAQLDAVNRYMNRAPYIVDPVNYRVPDYWATPRQFFNKDGDCEDYAIAKYLSLRALGVPASAMRVVVLQDQNLRLAHAVLAVYLDSKVWILDNQIRQVASAERIHHYRPIYSINEENWWVHRSAKRTAPPPNSTPTQESEDRGNPVSADHG